MRETKYIIRDDGLTVCAIVFNNHIQHNQMAFRLGIKPISAGFVKLHALSDGSIRADAFGESVSLNLKSRPEDGAIIGRMLNLDQG